MMHKGTIVARKEHISIIMTKDHMLLRKDLGNNNLGGYNADFIRRRHCVLSTQKIPLMSGKDI